MDRVRVLLLPGWQNSGPSHWQSRWQALHGWPRLTQDDWLWPRRGDWMMRLEEDLLADARPALLVAHSLGCHLVAAWAAHAQHTHRVAGALLVAPPDLERADIPPQVQAWAPMLRRPLPFASTAVITEIESTFSGDAYAPMLGPEWVEMDASPWQVSQSGLRYRFITRECQRSFADTQAH